MVFNVRGDYRGEQGMFYITPFVNCDCAAKLQWVKFNLSKEDAANVKLLTFEVADRDLKPQRGVRFSSFGVCRVHARCPVTTSFFCHTSSACPYMRVIRRVSCCLVGSPRWTVGGGNHVRQKNDSER